MAIIGTYVRTCVHMFFFLSCQTLANLHRGALNRTVGSTNMNAQSSRSHAIFTLHVKQERVVQVDEVGEDLGRPMCRRPNVMSGMSHRVVDGGSCR